MADLAVALAGATGGMASGMVTAASSYATLSLVGAALAFVVVLVALRPARPARPAQPTCPVLPLASDVAPDPVER